MRPLLTAAGSLKRGFVAPAYAQQSKQVIAFLGGEPTFVRYR